MRRRIIIGPIAELDIRAHVRYIKDRNPAAAARFLKACRATFQQAAEMPGSGVEHQYNTPELSGMRMLAIRGFRNYLAFYITTTDSIAVVRVFHGAQNIDEILGRSRDEH